MNPAAQGTPISCPNCGQRFAANIESIVDGGRDPGAKARFLSGRTNVVQCPNCGVVVQLAVPLVYHDHTKELLVIFFPPNLNLPTQEREKIVGEMTRAIMNSLPQEDRKGYLFKPIQPLTYEGMVELVLEKEGITKEMIQQQRDKMRLVEQFLMADAATLPDLAQQYDSQLDAEFFQMMTLSAEAALASGRRTTAEEMLDKRDQLVALSSYGQQAMQSAQQQEAVVMEVANWLQQRQQNLSIDEFIDYLEKVGGSDDHLQALVGLVRPTFNYQFFSALDQRIQNSDGQQAQVLTEVRDRLLELTSAMDQQQQAMVQQAQMVLRDILNAPDQDQAIIERITMIDDMFLQVLQATIQAADQRGDLLLSARLKAVYDKIVGHLQASAPPEVRFINDLLRSDPLEAKLMLSERAAEFGIPLVDYMDALIENLAGQGAEEMADRLVELRDAALKVLDAE